MLDLFVFFALLLVFALTSKRLERLSVGAPIAFTLAGFLVAELRGRPLGLEPSVTHHLAEAVLVIVLFHDASSIRLKELRAESGQVMRLLLIGLPLTIGAGYAVGSALMPELGTGLALFLAAALAPTDAGLGEATVTNPVVPPRVRSILNVESGLNDGLATPVVLTALAVAAGEGFEPGGALREILVGVIVGVVVGAAGRRALTSASEHDWTTIRGRSLALLAVPILAYLAAVLVGSNGFIAAFVAGIAYAAAGGPVEHDAPDTVIVSIGDGLGAAVWYLFGAAVGPVLADIDSWEPVVFALLSLTVLRMVPVALALLGSGFRWKTVWFVGWFGPRGLASLIFALLSLEALGGEEGPFIAGHREVLATIGLTVLLSVVAHGFSGEPLAERYGRWFGRERPVVEASGS